LLLLTSGRPRSGMAFLGLAAMTKGFPLVAAPVALAWLAARADRRTLAQSAVALLAALALPAAAAVAMSPSGSWEAVSYHAERPVQIESLPASAILLLDELGPGEAESVKSHRSDGLEHPAAEALTLICLLAMTGFIALVTTRSTGGSRELVLGSLAAVAAFAALGKALSPQYMLWLVPLGALAFAWRLHALAAAVAAATVLTQLEFPARYFDLVEREPFPVAVVGIRNLVLLGVLGLALGALRSAARQQHLLDRERPPAGVALDEDRVQPGVLV
jgi:MFS family permease